MVGGHAGGVVVLRGLVVQVFAGIEPAVGAHAFGIAEVHEVLVHAIGVIRVTGVFERRFQTEGVPAVAQCRKLVVEVGFVVKPVRYCHVILRRIS